jgi:iron complex transport system substrate-binding protein
LRTRRLAGLVGRQVEGDALATQLQDEWAATGARVAQLGAGRPVPSVLFVLSHSMAQLRIGGRGTAADATITYAGGRNAVGELDGFKPLTPESVVAAAPQLILTTEQSLNAAGGIDGLVRIPGLAATPAGRGRRVVALDALYLLGFGPRLPQAVAQLAGLLHAGAESAPGAAAGKA